MCLLLSVLCHSEKEVLHYYRNLRGHSRGDAIVRYVLSCDVKCLGGTYTGEILKLDCMQ